MGDLVDRDAPLAAHAGHVDRDQRQRSDGPELDSGPEAAAAVDLLRAFGGEQVRGGLLERNLHLIPFGQLVALGDAFAEPIGQRGRDGWSFAAADHRRPGRRAARAAVYRRRAGRLAGRRAVGGLIADDCEEVLPVAPVGVLEASAQRPLSAELLDPHAHDQLAAQFVNDGAVGRLRLDGQGAEQRGRIGPGVGAVDRTEPRRCRR